MVFTVTIPRFTVTIPRFTVTITIGACSRLRFVIQTKHRLQLWFNDYFCIIGSASLLRSYRKGLGSKLGSVLGSPLTLLRVETTTDTMETIIPVACLTIMAHHKDPSTCILIKRTSKFQHGNVSFKQNIVHDCLIEQASQCSMDNIIDHNKSINQRN